MVQVLYFKATGGKRIFRIGAATHQPATSGTVMLAALPILVGIQCLIAFLHYDVSNVPNEPVSLALEISS